MFNLDLITFAPRNREYFWQATQKALTKWKTLGNDLDTGVGFLLIILLDMHKRIKRGEDPILLNDMMIKKTEPIEQLGTGW